MEVREYRGGAGSCTLSPQASSHQCQKVNKGPGFGGASVIKREKKELKSEAKWYMGLWLKSTSSVRLDFLLARRSDFKAVQVFVFSKKQKWNTKTVGNYHRNGDFRSSGFPHCWSRLEGVTGPAWQLLKKNHLKRTFVYSFLSGRCIYPCISFCETW